MRRRFERVAHLRRGRVTLLNAADAWERAGEIAHAADDCDRALAMPNVADAHRADAQKCIERLGPKLATLDFRGPSTIAVRVDGGAQLIVPIRRRVAPGHHAITVVDLGSSQSRVVELDVKAGDARAVDVAPGAPPAPTQTEPPPLPPPAPERSTGLPTSAWIAFGVGGVAAAVATTFGLFTLGAKSNFDNGDTAQSTADTFHRDKAITNVAWIVAGAALATGAVIWIASPRTSLAVSPTAGGATLVGQVRFR
jgi:hypothetical protein